MTPSATLDSESPDTSAPSSASQSPLRRRFFGSPDELPLIVSLLLALGTLLVYEPSLRNGFVSYDDGLYVTQNPAVLHGLSWAGLRWALHTTAVDYWHPLTWLLHMTEVQLFGLRPGAYHFVSLVLHVVNVVLLFHLLRKATGFLTRSAVVATLFAVFPLNVESVAWMAETKTVLCTTFFLLALWTYGSYAKRPGISRYLAVVLFFGLGLMAKPMVVTLPLALLLLDYWPLQRLRLPSAAMEESHGPRVAWARLLLEKVPLLALSAASALSTMTSQKQVGAVIPTSLYPVSWRVKNILWSYADYVLKAIWPAHLAAFYPFVGRTLSVAYFFAAIVLLSAISALVWRFRAKRYVVAGWLWYLVMMLPVIGIVQSGSQGMADRYAYVPFWGLFVAAVWLIGDLASAARVSQPALTAVAACILAAYSAVSFVQVHIWHDSFALFFHAAKVTSGNALAEENIAGLYMEDGKNAQALPHYQAAAQYLFGSSIVHYNYATDLQDLGHFADAAREYQLALTYETSLQMAWQEHVNLGSAYAHMNRFAGAVSEFNIATQLKPNDALAYKDRGLVECFQKNFTVARADFTRAIQTAPDAQLYSWLGRILQDEGDAKGAAKYYAEAQRLAPTSTSPRPSPATRGNIP